MSLLGSGFLHCGVREWRGAPNFDMYRGHDVGA